MTEKMTPEQLNEIEINVELYLAYQNAPLSEYIDADDVLALVVALREAWAERDSLQEILDDIRDNNLGRPM